MLPSLANQFISDTYYGILHTANVSLSTVNYTPVYDGYGNQSPVQVGANGLKIGSMEVPLSAGSVGQFLGTDGTNLIFKNIFPVNSIYFTATDTNPSTFLGGVWVQVGQGKFIAGVGQGTDANSNTYTFTAGNNNLGEYSHTLTTSEMPTHTHDPVLEWASGSDDNAGYTGYLGSSPRALGYSGKNLANLINPFTGVFQPSMTVTSTGGGSSHNNIPPYMGLYVWQRIA